jgi:RNA polymerase sigma-70 factor, ECF subfamily
VNLMAASIDQADETLLQLIGAREADALSILYDRYAPTIYPLIAAIIQIPDDAETILIETFWQAWQEAEQQPKNTVAWLRGIARARSLDFLRRTLAAYPPLTDILPAIERQPTI